ncbi:MAG: hypothetical protein HRU19_04865 [Pseudobacteriovorax sp.]|nr:hypothetical protein [Pseudobacteriovorax sp.]
MKISFCEFLVESGIVTPEIMVQAFIQQSKGNKSLPRLIKDNNLLTTDQILAVYEHQTSEHCSFEKSCQVLGYWSEEFSLQLDGIIKDQVPSIFLYLLKNQHVTFTDLTVKLDEYVAMVIESPSDFGIEIAA